MRPLYDQSVTGGPKRFDPGVPLRKPSSIGSQIAPMIGIKADEHPPAGFVAVMKAFDIDDDAQDQRDPVSEDGPGQPDAQFGIVASRRHVLNG